MVGWLPRWARNEAKRAGWKVWLSPEWKSARVREPSCSMTGGVLVFSLAQKQGRGHTVVLVQVVKMQGQEIARRRRLQSLDRHEKGGFGGEVDRLLEACDEVGEGHVPAVAREVSMVGEGVEHGTRAAAVRWGGGLPSVVDGSGLLLACEGLYDGDGAVEHLAEEG